ncbi:MAG: DinB family protein [Acidobacteria bacterium]|nr:DinB family protein [Acidobacteriota bacterium]
MKHLMALSCLAVLVFLSAAPAGAEEEMSAFHRDLIANLEATGQKLISLAEATPENMFSWRPTKDVRSVSEVYMHVVGANMLIPPALGATPPEGVEIPENAFALMKEWETTVTAKADVVAKLKESLEYAKAALASIQDLDAEVTLFGPPQTKRAYFFILQGHAHEHLGQSIAYARSFGVAPPWSRPMPAGDGGGE